MVQFARPASDISTGVWSATPLWSKINDVVGSGDAIEIASDNDATDVFVVTLSAIDEPAAGTVTIRTRPRKGATGGMTILETVELLEGAATVRATFGPAAIPDSTAFATREHVLTTLERDAITDWGNLRVRYTRTHTGASNRNMRLADLELEAPDAAAAGAEVDSSVSGGGSVTSEVLHSAAPASTVTGGGTVASAVAGAHFVASGVSGGGGVTSTAVQQGPSAESEVSGGGGVTSTVSGAHTVASSVSGGGGVRSRARGPAPLRVEVDRHGGAGYEDWSAYVEPFPALSVDNIATEESGSASVPFLDPPATPENDWGLRITDQGVENFEGFIRGVRHEDLVTTDGPRIEVVTGVDFTALLDDDIVPRTWRGVAETDKQRITWLIETFGTHGITAGAEVQSIIGSMPEGTDGRPEQEFGPSTLRQALTKVTRLSGGRLYVDFDLRLHHYADEALAAPFALSDDPDDEVSFGYYDFKLEDDDVPRVDEVVVFGAQQEAGGLLEVTRTVPDPPPAERRRRAPLVDEKITTVGEGEAAGDAYLAANAGRRSGSLRTLQGGLRAGQTVQITHTGHGLDAEAFRVHRVRLRPDSAETAIYEVQFGDEPPSLSSMLGGSSGAVTLARGAAAGAIEALRIVADLSVAGANMVPNSSFESASTTGWTVGAGWTYGFSPVGPQEAPFGSKTARLVRAGSAAGALLTPFIPVARSDDWWCSYYSFLRSITAGSLRARVYEYDAAQVLLATHELAVPAVAETEPTRYAMHFGPNDQLGRTAFHASTRFVRMEFDDATTGTFTWDVDGIQVERGKLLTAYAPVPSELVDLQVGTTQIADDAVTTAKVIANAIVAGKIAASAVTADKIAAAAVVADKIAAGAVLADKVSVGAKPTLNEVLNPSFEDVIPGGNDAAAWTKGWQVNGAGASDSRTVTGLAIAGALAYLLEVPGGSGSSIASKSFPVTPGERFYLSARVLGGVGGTGDGFYLRLACGPVEDFTTAQQIAYASDVVSNVNAPNVWTQHQGYLTIPATALWARVVLFHDLPAGPAGDMYFDDVVCYRVASGVKNSTGHVLVDGSGITVTDAEIIVTDSIGTVVIDGSNMFKIADITTHSVTVADDSFGETVATLTGLGALPKTPAHVSYVATANTNGANQHLGLLLLSQGDLFAASGSGGSPTIKFKSLRGDGEAHTNLNGSDQARVYITGRNLSGVSVTFYGRTYTLVEAAR